MPKIITRTPSLTLELLGLEGKPSTPRVPGHYLLEVAEGASHCLRIRELQLLGECLLADHSTPAWLCPHVHKARGQPTAGLLTAELTQFPFGYATHNLTPSTGLLAQAQQRFRAPVRRRAECGRALRPALVSPFWDTAYILRFKGTYPAFCSTFPSSQSRGSKATFSWPTTITGRLPTNSHSVAGMPRALQDREGWRSRGGSRRHSLRFPYSPLDQHSQFPLSFSLLGLHCLSPFLIIPSLCLEPSYTSLWCLCSAGLLQEILHGTAGSN